MKYFVAKLVFRIVCGKGDHRPQFDEQLRLIQAFAAADAFDKAASIGRSEEDVFLNEKSQLVQWQFINVTELTTIENLSDGMELYSKIIEHDDADAYCTFVNRRAEALREQQISVAETNLHS